MRYILYTLFACMLAVGASAQSRAVMRKMFNDGKFEEAKPIFEKLLKANPKNSEYSYWYAACCLETGDTTDVRGLLEFAISRKIVNAHRYLGDYYFGKNNYPSAAECYEEFLDLATDDSLATVFQNKLNVANQLARMVKNCYKVCVVDSVVVDKDKFLSAYRMGNDVGTISTCAGFFGDDSLPGYAYSTERGMDVFFSDNDGEGSLSKLYVNSKIGDEWGRARALKGFETNGNDDYPFMLADGVTLYFASDGDASIGGYDIFVSRLDTESGRFLRPDNMGMPFNSTANDYMMAINEVANIGWFASDRNQPEGKVCVYIFVPDAERVKYDADALGYDRMYSLASISSIADTWADEAVLRKARQQLALLAYARNDEVAGASSKFIIDDTREYGDVADFKSDAAREMFIKWQGCAEQHRKNCELLENKRDEYAGAGVAEKEAMRSEILALEAQVEKESAELVSMEREVRRLEQEALYN